MENINIIHLELFWYLPLVFIILWSKSSFLSPKLTLINFLYIYVAIFLILLNVMLKYLFFIFVLGNYKKAVASKSYRRIYRHVEMIFFLWFLWLEHLFSWQFGKQNVYIDFWQLPILQVQIITYYQRHGKISNHVEWRKNCCLNILNFHEIIWLFAIKIFLFQWYVHLLCNFQINRHLHLDMVPSVWF